MQPLVGVIMGSKSDWETMSHAADTLEQLGVPFEVKVVSAHRTPELLLDYAGSAEGRSGIPAVALDPAPPGSRAVPQSPQKRAVGRLDDPHVRQATASGAPQVSQKRRPASFSVPQAEQTIRTSRGRLDTSVPDKNR